MIEALQAENADLKKNLSLAGSKQNELKVSERATSPTWWISRWTPSSVWSHSSLCVALSPSLTPSLFSLPLPLPLPHSLSFPHSSHSPHSLSLLTLFPPHSPHSLSILTLSPLSPPLLLTPSLLSKSQQVRQKFEDLLSRHEQYKVLGTVIDIVFWLI